LPRHLLLCLSLSSAILVFTASSSRLHAEPAQTVPPARVTNGQLMAALERISADIAAIEFAADAAALAASVPETWRVVDADEGKGNGRSGQVDVNMRWLIAALSGAAAKPDAWPNTRATLLRRLTNIREELASRADSQGAGARTEARAAVDAILAQREFQQSAASRWRAHLQERVGEWFEDLLGRFGPGRGAARSTALVFAWAAALAALVGAGFWLARTIADRPRGAALDLAGGTAPRPRARELALRALAATRDGRTRDAVRCAHSAALARLEEQGVWRVVDSLTPREYLPMLPVTDKRHAALVHLTRCFEQVWYGNRTPATDDVLLVADHLETLGCLRPGERAI
jgi:hypothetical protein